MSRYNVAKCRSCDNVVTAGSLVCDLCKDIKSLVTHNSKKSLTARIYTLQRSNSKARGHQMPTYDLNSLREWLYSKSLFHELYDDWARLDYKKDFKPSVNRIDNNYGYSMSNIEVMTWRENYMLERDAQKNGEYLSYSKQQHPVAKIDKDDNSILAVYPSCNHAERETGINRQNIQSVLSGKRKKAGGFKWAKHEFEIEIKRLKEG